MADDRRLFEKSAWKDFSPGLSWLTILNKREGFRAAFAQFDAEQVAAFDQADVERLVQDAAIVRHRGKIEVHHQQRPPRAGAAPRVWLAGPLRVAVRAPRGSRPGPSAVHARSRAHRSLSTAASVAIVQRPEKRGWSFARPHHGVYAFMQATLGLVSDHLEGCHARARRCRRAPPCRAARVDQARWP